jgi:predicted DNA-binding protein (MmcQ/YjbR family)
MPRPDPLAAAELALRDFALAFPDTTEDFPWDHRAIKVKGKLFVIFANHEGRLNITVKLPVSGPAALALANVEPTGYGLGKHGWVTASLPADELTLALLEEWIDESYRAVAPKSVLAKLRRAEGGKDEIITYVKPKAKRAKKSKPKKPAR